MRDLVFMFVKDGIGLFFFSLIGSEIPGGVAGSSGEGVGVLDPQGVPWLARIVQRHSSQSVSYRTNIAFARLLYLI